uniref:Secreted protein n=1 Tax=Anopheles coluzzii TaxID=1518534 RepID=A0A8W7PWK9_ANOCL
MKSNQMLVSSSVVICLGLLLCTMHAGVESAPIVAGDDVPLHVLPLAQEHVGDDSLLRSFDALAAAAAAAAPHSRSKREIIFRPLFVYRQQQIKRQKHHTTTTIAPYNFVNDYDTYDDAYQSYPQYPSV